MEDHLIKHIESKLDEKIQNTRPLSGGDISQIFKISTASNEYALKTNKSYDGLDMFQKEKFGLETIQNTNTIAVPKVIDCDILNDTAFILMEYIKSKSPSEKDFELFGQHLANLHQITNELFGLTYNNFIGSLPQSNTKHKDWTSFYFGERLMPQLKLALKKKILSKSEIPSEQQMVDSLNPLFQNVQPSLLHGDLWSGNFLVATDGTPYLIDPAIYFGHHEVDIAMTKLFGGFASSFYDAYTNVFPSDSKRNYRIEIYQLYYLLVHLNLFGSSYYPSVKSLLSKLF